MAAGATHAYFGHPEWEQFAPGLKTIEDAIEIRRRVLLAFEMAEREALTHGQHPPLNFVVIGAGPTGVELAGAIADISRRYMEHDFRAIDPRRARILLLEGGPRVLAAFPEDLSTSAEKQLTGVPSYAAATTITAELPQMNQRGAFELLRQFSAPHELHFKPVHFSGDSFVKSNLIVRLLQQDVEHAQKDDAASTAITAAHYKFIYRGNAQVNGADAYIFEVKPRAKAAGLFSLDAIWLTSLFPAMPSLTESFSACRIARRIVSAMPTAGLRAPVKSR